MKPSTPTIDAPAGSLFGEPEPALRLVRPTGEIVWPVGFESRNVYAPPIPLDHPQLAELFAYMTRLLAAGPVINSDAPAGGLTDAEAAGMLRVTQRLIRRLRDLGHVLFVYESSAQRPTVAGEMQRVYVHGRHAGHRDTQHHWEQLWKQFGEEPTIYAWNRSSPSPAAR